MSSKRRAVLGEWLLPSRSSRARPGRALGTVFGVSLLLAGCQEWGYEGARPYQPELMVPSDSVARLQACSPSNWAKAEPSLVADGLEVPWDLLFLPDGRLLFTERSGAIRLINDAGLAPAPWAVIPGWVEEENGLMGLAYWAPSDTTPGFVYAVVTVPGEAPLAPEAHLPGLTPETAAAAKHRVPGNRNQIIRIADGGDRGGSIEVLVDGIPADLIHAGGGLAIGPDSKLYLGVGEAMGWGGPNKRGLGPLWSSAIHRYNPDGSIPFDNPDPTSAVFAVGFRNPQAFDWHPNSGQLFVADHGPSNLEWEFGMFGRDEINVVEPGRDYGWPSVSGMGSGGGFAWPIRHWDGLVPGGLTFWVGSDGSSELFVSGLRGVRLVRIELERGDTATDITAVCQEELLVGRLGRIRALAQGPDGALYLSTTNGDGRGEPDPNGDQIYRLLPDSSS